MSTRINITLTDEENEKLMKCYKHFIAKYEGMAPPLTMTGYAASLVVVTLNRILEEEKL